MVKISPFGRNDSKDRKRESGTERKSIHGLHRQVNLVEDNSKRDYFIIQIFQAPKQELRFFRPTVFQRLLVDIVTQI